MLLRERDEQAMVNTAILASSDSLTRAVTHQQYLGSEVSITVDGAMANLMCVTSTNSSVAKDFFLAVGVDCVRRRGCQSHALTPS